MYKFFHFLVVKKEYSSFLKKKKNKQTKEYSSHEHNISKNIYNHSKYNLTINYP